MIALIAKQQVVEWVEGKCRSWIVRIEGPFGFSFDLLLLSRIPLPSGGRR
jgi:hypothetical protein